ncbi:MAG: hypothetical protein ABH863_00565 [Candidatus Micrarchaeota archaeon]
MKSHAFIAAPLIGTLIFLVSIIMIINLSRAESSSISETISDSYHNKLVSIVEIYRSDLGSIFNIGLQRNIEYALTSQCWSNFISLETKKKLDPPGPGTCSGTLCENPNNDDIVTEEEERYYTCKRASNLVQEVVCVKNSSYLFGLPDWAKIISEQTSFEGISLEAANGDDFLEFIGYTAIEQADGNDLCKELVSNIELDCTEFAKGATGPTNYKCCSSFNDDGSCNEVPGCESGDVFYVRITVENDQVYGKFPRVLAKDQAGNQIRAGAISDVDFDAPISYPFFKYLDAAFRFNRVLSKGTDNNDGAFRGITEGSCIGKYDVASGCPKVSLDSGLEFPAGATYGGQSFNNGQEAKDAYANIFFPNTLKAACEEVAPLAVTFGFSTGEKTCPDIYNSLPDQQAMDEFNIRDSECPADASTHCAFITELNRDVTFVDTDPKTQVKADTPNEFCWYSRPKYYGEPT